MLLSRSFSQPTSSTESLNVHTEWNRITFKYLAPLAVVFFAVVESNAIDY